MPQMQKQDEVSVPKPNNYKQKKEVCLLWFFNEYKKFNYQGNQLLIPNTPLTAPIKPKFNQNTYKPPPIQIN
jgi:hypothetical protein